jgi:hypothetical protein
VWIGDSGQGDVLFAQRARRVCIDMGRPPPLAFIHDIVINKRTQRRKTPLQRRVELACEGIYLFDTYLEVSRVARPF